MRYCYSANESKELIINVTQTIPKEELPSSPSQPGNQSPLATPTRSLTQPKYQTSLTRLSSGGRVIEPEHFSDSNGHFASHRDYEHTPIFLHTTPEDSNSYYNHHELYYPPAYNEIEGPYATLTGSVGSQSRPFSASSSSCSSVESGATSDNPHHYQSPGGLNPLAAVTVGTVNATSEFVIASNCFDPHSPPQTTWSGAIAHQTDFKHEFAHHSAHNPGYTSVIVESQQYQLANEYVH